MSVDSSQCKKGEMISSLEETTYFHISPGRGAVPFQHRGMLTAPIKQDTIIQWWLDAGPAS